MSHQPERKEKNCLNCGTIVAGRFCQHCGQENIVTRESFLTLSKHFIYDILHFDGSFFHTLKYLFIKPGYVARQYAEGKRATYVHPIRMYLFTSAVFFLIFFSTNSFKIDDNRLSGNLSKEQRMQLAEKYQGQLKNNNADSFLKSRIALLLDSTKKVNIDSLGWNKNFQVVSFSNENYYSISEYDSLQNTLPEKERHGWLAKKFTRQAIRINEKYSKSENPNTELVTSFLHKLPYMLFLSLPFFALLLKLLYIRRKNFYYSDHAIFTLFHYILTFLLLLIVFGIDAIQSKFDWDIFTIIKVILYTAWPLFLFIEMKNFYRQGTGKTLIKFLLLNFFGFTFMLILFVIFMVFSFFQT